MSFWARIASPMAGSGRGMFILPEIGDEVLVAFEHGDIHRPYVLGQLWNGKDKPPGTNSKDNKNPIHGGSSEVNRRGFTTRIGHTMDFDDTDGKGKIMLKTAGGHVLNLDDAGKCCDLTTTGNHKVEVSDKTKSISITSTAGHNVEVDDKSNSVTIKTAGGQMAKLTDSGGLVMLKDVAGDTLTMTSGMVNLTGMQMITLAAPIINVTGSIAVNVAALNTNIAAGALATMNGGAAVQIAGGMVVDVKSTLIKLNS